MTGPLRLERRLDTPKWLKLAVPLVSIVLAAIIVGILLAATGHNPFSTYHQMYSASVTADGALTSTFVYATPMLFTGLCAAFAFRMRTFNIGGEGQLYMGAVGASAIGLVLGDWPRPLLIVAMVVGGALAGMLWACIPGLLRGLSAHERDPHLAHAQLRCRLLHVLPDLRQHLVLAGPDHARGDGVPDRQDAGGKRHLAGDHHRVVHAANGLRARHRLGRRTAPPHPRDPLRLRDADHGRFAAGGQLRRHPHETEDRLGDGDIGWDRRNRWIQPDRRLRARADPRGLEQAQYGYTGIVVAALALYNPLAVVLVSLLIGGLTNAGFALEGPSFPTGLVGTMEGIILFTVLGGEILARYRIGLRHRAIASASVGPAPATEMSS